MPSPSGLSIVTGSTASVSRDGRREVFQLAVHAQGDDGAIGEEGEAVGGIGHVRRQGDVSQGNSPEGGSDQGYSASGARRAPPAQARAFACRRRRRRSRSTAGAIPCAQSSSRSYADCVGAGGSHARVPLQSTRSHQGSIWAEHASHHAAEARAADRVRRPLRCGEADVHEFVTADGVSAAGLRGSSGGPKGPVILSPGFGTSSIAYTIDTVETNYPEYLYEHGYDVWVLDYRASPAAAVRRDAVHARRHRASTTIPPPSRRCAAATGAESVQIVAHCVGSLTMLMALGLGLTGRTFGGRVAAHPAPARRHAERASCRHLRGRRVRRSGRRCAHDRDRRRPVVAREALRQGARRLPVGRRAVRPPVLPARDVHVRRGLRPRPPQRRDPRPSRRGIRRRQPHDVPADLQDPQRRAMPGATTATYDYLDGAERSRHPDRLHPRRGTTGCSCPRAARSPYEFLREHNDPALYSRHVIPRYAHMDCFVGKDAARDVYPLVTAQLDLHN